MDIEKAREFLYRNARPLDLARWRYLFEGGSREDVLEALAAYQNEDGGFGHGLEPDCWNPNSSPIQTAAAAEILREIGMEDSRHPILQGILTYLASGRDFDGHTWSITVPSNDAYPHAPWWSHTPAQEPSYNPTAGLTGFLLRHAEPDSPLYRTAVRLAKEAYDFLKANAPLESMHTMACFMELLEALRACGRGADLLDLDAFEQLLGAQIRHVLTRDTSVWETEYVCKPSLFIHSKLSPFYAENREICDLECDFISRTQQADGTWAITWEWEAYPEQWSVSKHWWKSDLILKNVKFYSAMRS